MDLTRRRFLQWSSAGLAASASAPRLAFAAPGDPTRGDALVFLFLRGGMDGLTAVVTKKPDVDEKETSKNYAIHPT